MHRSQNLRSRTTAAVLALLMGITALFALQVPAAAAPKQNTNSLEKISAGTMRDTPNTFILKPEGSKPQPTISTSGSVSQVRVTENWGANSSMADLGGPVTKYPRFQQNYGATTFVMNQSTVDDAVITLVYPDAALYNGQSVDVELRVSDIAYANHPGDSYKRPRLGFSDSLYSGWYHYSVSDYKMQIRLLNGNGKTQLVNDAWFTFNSLNGETLSSGWQSEFVAFTNRASGSKTQVTSDTNIGWQSYKGVSVLGGISNDFTDDLGADDFTRNSVSFEMDHSTANGSRFQFFFGRLGGASAWTTLSSATLFQTPPPAPTLTVSDPDQKDGTSNAFWIRDTLTYSINQEVEYLGVSTMGKYGAMTLSATLPVGVEYLPNSWKLVNKATGKTETSPGTFTAKGRVVTFVPSAAFRARMPMLGETYALVFNAKLTNPDVTTTKHTATATSYIRGGSGASRPSNSVTSTLSIAPAVTLTKTLDKTAYTTGTPVTHTFTVKNTGDVTLRGVAVKDPKIPSITLSKTTLSPGETATGKATVTATAADVTAGAIASTATVTGKTGTGVARSDTSATTVSSAAIKVTTTIDGPKTYKVGETRTFRFTVTNTGKVAADNIAVTHNRLGTIGTIAKLAPGASTVLTKQAPVTVTN